MPRKLRLGAVYDFRNPPGSGMRPQPMNHSLERFARDVVPTLREMFAG
jgi:hypothetical protein